MTELGPPGPCPVGLAPVEAAPDSEPEPEPFIRGVPDMPRGVSPLPAPGSVEPELLEPRPPNSELLRLASSPSPSDAVELFDALVGTCAHGMLLGKDSG